MDDQRAHAEAGSVRARSKRQAGCPCPLTDYSLHCSGCITVISLQGCKIASWGMCGTVEAATEACLDAQPK